MHGGREERKSHTFPHNTCSKDPRDWYPVPPLICCFSAVVKLIPPSFNPSPAKKVASSAPNASQHLVHHEVINAYTCYMDSEHFVGIKILTYDSKVDLEIDSPLKTHPPCR
jgi:hypothetical protein